MVSRLAGLLDAQSMRRLNAEVAVKGYAEVASEFLAAHSQVLNIDVAEASAVARFWSETLSHVLRHLQLTGLALGAAIVLGLAVSLAIFSKPRVANAVVYFCGLLQTVPSLALLALMIQIFGIGFCGGGTVSVRYCPLCAMRLLHCLLLTRHWFGFQALGLSRWQQLRHLRLPLSLPMIFAGIRTAAVISIGTATLAAFGSWRFR